MSTNSRIGILNKDGTVRSIYCHWDGYIENNGKILVDMYDNEKSINQLLDLGDISCLGNNPVSKPELWTNNKIDPNYEYTRAYRDRGEDCPAQISESVEEYLNELSQEFTYLFKDGEWYVDYVDEDAYERDEDDIRRMDKVKDKLRKNS